MFYEMTHLIIITTELDNNRNIKLILWPLNLKQLSLTFRNNQPAFSVNLKRYLF